MAIPDFQTLMLPLLKVVADGREYRLRDVVELLAKEFYLTDEERQQLLPSGRYPTFDNRIAWAKTYLKKSGLIDQPRRAYFQITERGREVLKSSPSLINMKFLEQFPEYIAFKESTEEVEEQQRMAPSISAQNETPEELIENGARTIRKELAGEILQRVKGCPPAFFERLVVELLVKMGYGGTRQDAGRAIGRSGDEGIDGVIHEDRLDLPSGETLGKRGWAAGDTEIRRCAARAACQEGCVYHHLRLHQGSRRIRSQYRQQGGTD